ncbi:cupin domain-containing protein [Halorientalis litorea]|jgi:quercetin dioxygenase-like cupin family protein|uniref:cupin domain-containing protein n=1 Tax=Halorientalis litorea TaxID=2931977 RepID=UPI001FF0FC66|nr:cupin domain-containing protein [Halorientalis litorea]
MVDRASLPALSDGTHARPFPDGEPDVVRLALDAGESIPSHTHPERRIVFHLLSSTLALTVDDETHHLDAGDIVRFDGRSAVSPDAIEDSEALLVLAERS